MPFTPPPPDALLFRVLAITQGAWGTRIADNIDASCPAGWLVRRWQAPAVLPAIVDDPDEFLPESLPPSDLVLALGDTPGVAQLVPDVVRLAGARAVIAPIDRNESLPPGLVGQLRRWLSALGVNVVFPKPFCSLTETTYNLPPIIQRYDDALIARFARHFGRPELLVAVEAGQITSSLVSRDAACGCGRHVAAGLAGCQVAEAEHAAGMLHHHYPCLASMNTDPDYGDTLMHVSGNLLRQAVRDELADHLPPVAYLRPHGLSQPGTKSGG
jgi:thymidylate synthase